MFIHVYFHDYGRKGSLLSEKKLKGEANSGFAMHIPSWRGAEFVNVKGL